MHVDDLSVLCLEGTVYHVDIMCSYPVFSFSQNNFDRVIFENFREYFPVLIESTGYLFVYVSHFQGFFYSILKESRYLTIKVVFLVVRAYSGVDDTGILWRCWSIVFDFHEDSSCAYFLGFCTKSAVAVPCVCCLGMYSVEFGPF